MKVKIERIENQIVTCSIIGEDDTPLIDAPQEYFSSNINVGDIVETKFEYQSKKKSFPY